jgi:hypothetical protein
MGGHGLYGGKGGTMRPRIGREVLIEGRDSVR